MIALVTDSGACLKKAEAETLHVRVVPMSYLVGDHVYYETYSDQNEDFETLLQNETSVSTSHPNPSFFMNCFEEVLAAGDEVLCITTSSRLSGAYSSAQLAAQQTGDDKIAVLDSRLIAGGMLLLIRQARRWIDEGLDRKEIISRLESRRERIRTAFTVDDMTPLRVSGRLGFVRMSVGTVLNIKPILLLQEGIIVSGGTTRGSAEIITNLTRSVLRNEPSNDASPVHREFIINYINATRLASNLYHVLEERFPEAVLCLQKIGPILQIHMGASAVSVAYDRWDL